MDKNLASGPFWPVAATSRHIAHSPLCQKRCEELQMALSKHTTAGTQGKGDRSCWGSTERDRIFFFGGGAHMMSSCTSELFLHHATISND